VDEEDRRSSVEGVVILGAMELAAKAYDAVSRVDDVDEAHALDLRGGPGMRAKGTPRPQRAERHLRQPEAADAYDGTGEEEHQRPADERRVGRPHEAGGMAEKVFFGELVEHVGGQNGQERPPGVDPIEQSFLRNLGVDPANHVLMTGRVEVAHSRCMSDDRAARSTTQNYASRAARWWISPGEMCSGG